jgi:hypothetical protein
MVYLWLFYMQLDPILTWLEPGFSPNLDSPPPRGADLKSHMVIPQVMDIGE